MSSIIPAYSGQPRSFVGRQVNLNPGVERLQDMHCASECGTSSVAVRSFELCLWVLSWWCRWQGCNCDGVRWCAACTGAAVQAAPCREPRPCDSHCAAGELTGESRVCESNMTLSCCANGASFLQHWLTSCGSSGSMLCRAGGADICLFSALCVPHCTSSLPGGGGSLVDEACSAPSGHVTHCCLAACAWLCVAG